MSDLDKSYTVRATFKYKLPFFVLGVAVGMFAVWVAMQWVPGALAATTL